MIGVFFFGLAFLLLVWNVYFAFCWDKNIVVAFRFLQQYVYAGEQAQMTECVENGKKLPLPILEVAFHVDKGLSFLDCENTNVSDYTYKRDIFALLGNQRIIRNLVLQCPKRGFYRIEETDLTTFSLLHERRFSAEYPADAQMYVYAARTDVSDIMSACERLMGNVQCAKRLFEDPFAFASIREYTLTDPMKAINWKASARTGELMVNTWESTLTEKAMLYLDLEDRGILKQESLIEESISIAACLAQKMTGRGMEVGICVNVEHRAAETAGTDYTYLSPAAGKRQLNSIEQMLARYKNEDKVLPFAGFLNELTNRVNATGAAGSANPASPASLAGAAGPEEDTVMIFISKNAVENAAAIEEYVGKTRQAIWVIPYPKNEECRIACKDNIRLVKREVAD
ncbi:MAG: DUF58 domain-containing protein [Roseburia sp.]|nr:DUF58 domain-containing protein [Roseburia sp.]MCM1241574.1 DUF58 domain-containing protein [Roseburia sp.]